MFLSKKYTYTALFKDIRIFRQYRLKKSCFIKVGNLLLKPSFLKLNRVEIKHCLKN